MKKEYDVLVIGSGTAGCFFAHEMASLGYSVCVVDSGAVESMGERLQIFHIDKEMFQKLGIPLPVAGDPDHISEFQVGTYYSPYGQYMKRNDGTEIIVKADYPFLICSLPPFIKRLRAWCETAGVEFFYDTSFQEFILEEKSVVGAVLKREGKEIKIKSRLVADCSGIASVARKTLPNPTTVENFDISSREMMYVLLQYVKLENPEKDAPKCAEHWAYYKGWIGIGPDEETCIFGTGAVLSYEYAQKCFDRFKAAVEMPKGEIIRREQGIIPYRRAPYSMVHDGFICLGDAACMNKWIGEGIVSGWVGCKIAAEVAGNAMKDGAYPTEEKLWEHNVRYNRGQAADFAYINATAINAVDCTPDEMHYEFKKGIVFNDKAMTRLNREFNAEMPFTEILSLIFKVAVGVLTRNISFKTLKNLLRGIFYAGKLKSHYRRFPKTPQKFPKWSQKANKLWQKTGNLADVTERVEERNEKKNKL
jgi:flavin-dependent dehydrogenase